ncbi:MAG: GGDEF domain-containing protein, partial [Nitrospiraceae bacterium]|nr:GGDEF domain-containing protein [Nitrospiraceae bacterium]
DVDFFKKVNDQYGHPAGDRALQHVVAMISQSIRKSDWFGRWGGEEFLLVCPNLPKKDAWARLDQIRETIRKPLELSPSVSIILTASVGVAIFPESPDLETLMSSADKALYTAKESGRNRVVLLE